MKEEVGSLLHTYVHRTEVILSLHVATISMEYVRCFDCEGLCQLQNSFVTDEDLRGRSITCIEVVAMCKHINIILV